MPLSGTQVVLIGLAACAVVAMSATWELIQHFEVMAHEGMHGIIGALSGGKVRSIELTQAAEGRTVVILPYGRSPIAFLFGGYLGPSAFGLAAARLIQSGHIVAVLWVTLLLLGLLLLVLKKSFGHLTVPLTGFLIFLLSHASPMEEIVAAYAIPWFLLLSGLRTVVEHGVYAADAGFLRNHTHIPSLVWFTLWLTGALAAVVIGAHWMLYPAIQ
jgi:hypothetical protein